MSTKKILFKEKELIITSLQHVNIDDAYNFKPTQEWLNKIQQQKELYLDDLEFRDIIYIEDKINFVFLSCKVRNHNLSKTQYIEKYKNDKNYYFPQYVCLKQNNFSLLPILSCYENNNLYTIVIQQTKLPILEKKNIEIITGVLSDDNGIIENLILQKIKEILDITNFNNLTFTDLGALSWSGKSKSTIYSSLINENIIPYAFHKKINLNSLKKKLIEQQNDLFKIKIIYLDDLWGYCNDSKTLASYCLYQNLVKYKSINKKLYKLRPNYPCSCIIN